jgi:hypothetical protein
MQLVENSQNKINCQCHCNSIQESQTRSQADQDPKNFKTDLINKSTLYKVTYPKNSASSDMLVQDTRHLSALPDTSSSLKQNSHLDFYAD